MSIYMKYIFVFIFLSFCYTVLPAQEPNREEIVFRSGDIVLNGTFVLPDTTNNIPVLIFMGGIEEWGDFHKQRMPFIEQNLEASFLQSGIGLLYYDPRGIGKSDGRWQRASLNDFADDAIAAIHFLKQRREVDPNRIGIIGHGESGWVAQIVAATNPDEIKLMASLAGPTFDPERQLVNEYHSEYVCADEDSTTAYQKAVQKATSHQNWVSLFPLTKRWRHMKMKIDFEPAEYITNIQIPSLFVFAENDGQVYPDWAIKELNEIFPGSLPSNFTIHTIAGANHFFHVAPPCFEYEDSSSESIDRDFSFRFREVLRNWIFENL